MPRELIRRDSMTRPGRFDGYDYFGEHPESPIDWFGAHAG
jgi:hypothetical protein